MTASGARSLTTISCASDHCSAAMSSLYSEKRSPLYRSAMAWCQIKGQRGLREGTERTDLGGVDPRRGKLERFSEEGKVLVVDGGGVAREEVANGLLPSVEGPSTKVSTPPFRSPKTSRTEPNRTHPSGNSKCSKTNALHSHKPINSNCLA